MLPDWHESHEPATGRPGSIDRGDLIFLSRAAGSWREACCPARLAHGAFSSAANSCLAAEPPPRSLRWSPRNNRIGAAMKMDELAAIAIPNTIGTAKLDTAAPPQIA